MLGFHLSSKEYKNTHHFFSKWWSNRHDMCIYSDRFFKIPLSWLTLRNLWKKLLKRNWQRSLILLLAGYLDYIVLPWLHWDPSGKLKWYVNLVYHPDHIFMWARVYGCWQAADPTLTQTGPGYHPHHVHICLNIYRSVISQQLVLPDEICGGVYPQWLNLCLFWQRYWFLPCLK